MVRTLEETPKNATHWSTRSMAAATGMSQSATSRIWRAFALAPHRSQTFRLSTDRCSSTRSATSSVSITIRRRRHECCVWMRNRRSRRWTGPSRSQPVLPGIPERRSHGYVRADTTTLFAALELATGKLIGSPHRRHRAAELKKFLAKLDREVPAGLQAHLVLDNYATHKTPAVKQWLLAHPRFHLHFTPASGSWLNLVERWLAEPTHKKLKRGVHRSVPALERDIRVWLTDGNTNPRPFIWTKIANEILGKIAACCQRISNSGH